MNVSKFRKSSSLQYVEIKGVKYYTEETVLDFAKNYGNHQRNLTVDRYERVLLGYGISKDYLDVIKNSDISLLKKVFDKWSKGYEEREKEVMGEIDKILKWFSVMKIFEAASSAPLKELRRLLSEYQNK